MTWIKRMVVTVVAALALSTAVVGVVDTPVTEVAAAEAHSYGCTPRGVGYPYYVTGIYRIGSWHRVYWVNVSTGYTHSHLCSPAVFGF